MGALGWASIAAASFAAALLTGASGFGFALLALPFYLIFLGPDHAVELVLILTTALAAVVLPSLRQAIVPGLLLRLLLGTLAGLPIGLVAFDYADPHWVRAGIGLAILAFAGLFLVVRRRVVAPGAAGAPGAPGAAGEAGEAGAAGETGSLFSGNAARYRAGDLAAGAVSGATTALAGIGGPPVLLYLLYTGVSPANLRATLFGFFLISYLLTVFSQSLTHGIAEATWLGAAGLFPFVLVGGFAGKRLGDRLGHEAFVSLALILLVVAGAYTLLSAFVPGRL